VRVRDVSGPRLVDRWLWFVLEVALLYWILDAAFQVLVFHEGTFLQQTFSPDPQDLLSRALVVCLVAIYGVYALTVLGKAKQAQRAARRVSAEADQMVSSVPQPICVIGKDLTLRQCNDAFAALFGVDREQVLARKCSEVLDASLCDATRRLVARVLAGEERVECDWEAEHAEEPRAPYRLVATPLKDAGGRCQGMIQSLFDPAAWDRGETLRQDLPQLASDLMLAAPSGLLVCEREPPDRFVLLDANPAAESLCQMAIAEWRGRELARMWPQAREAGLIEALAHVLSAGQPFEVTDLPCREGGKGGRLRVRAFLMPRDRVGLILDAASEEELARLHLEALLGQREALLEEIHRRHKDDLQVIANLLDLQCEMTRDEQTLQTLRDCRSRIGAITLAYQRVVEPDGEEMIDFAAYLGKLLGRLFRARGEGAGAVTSQVNVHTGPVAMDMAIPCALIVNELVSNSLKHAFPGGRDGEILIEVSPGAQGEYRIIVSDDGVGFPTGLDFRHTETLGLQLVSLLVDQLNGTIELDRREGTTFRIALPRAGSRCSWP